MISASQLIQQSSPFESSIQQILQLDGLRRDELKLNLKSYESGKSALDGIGSAFSSFQTVINTFEDNPAASFQSTKATASSDALRILSTETDAAPGSFDLQIDQLARRDTINSGQFMDSDTALSTAGSGSFSLVIGKETIDISVDTSGLTNKEILNEIVHAIENHENNSSGIISAARLQVNDAESVLSIKSTDSGTANRITIQNVEGDFQNLALDHLFLESELDAKFTVDGVSFTRSTNVVDDVIEGLSFELNAAQTGDQMIHISHDADTVRDNIQSFVDVYNELNDTIRKNTFLNSESGDRGPL